MKIQEEEARPQMKTHTATNVIDINNKINYSMEILNYMIQNNYLQVAQLFLGCNLVDCLTKMN